MADGVVYSNFAFQYGASTDVAIAGDWIGQGHDGIGAFRPSTATMFLKNLLTTGPADNALTYGASTDQPIAGHWQVIYPPIAPSIVIAKTAALTAVPNSGSVPGRNQIGG